VIRDRGASVYASLNGDWLGMKASHGEGRGDGGD
jgi:hypothetical protein